MSTNDPFDDMAEKMIAYAEVAIKNAALDLVLKLETRANGRLGSPVLTGRFEASHQIGINEVIETTAAPVVPYPKRGEHVEQTIFPPDPHVHIEQMKQFKLGDVIFVSNTVEYAEQLEDGGSRQAPGGVYGPTFAIWRAEFEAKLTQAYEAAASGEIVFGTSTLTAPF